MTLNASRPAMSVVREIMTRMHAQVGRYRYWSLRCSENGRWRQGEGRLPWLFLKRGFHNDGVASDLTIGVGRWALFVGSGQRAPKA